MIDYGLFQFAAPPKTGVTWFLNAVQLAGYGPGFRYRAFEPFNGVRKEGVIRVSLVVHPYLWLHRIYESISKGELSLQEACIPISCVGSFEQFVNQYLSSHVGFLTRYYSLYEADLVLRLEDMPYALEEFLESLGTDSLMMDSFRRLRSRIYSSPPNNRQLKFQVVKAEWEFCDRYDYI